MSQIETYKDKLNEICEKSKYLKELEKKKTLSNFVNPIDFLKSSFQKTRLNLGAQVTDYQQLKAQIQAAKLNLDQAILEGLVIRDELEEKLTKKIQSNVRL